LAPDIGGKENKYMKGKIKYTDEPIGKVKVIKDFLPSPADLALKKETVKVTISLSRASSVLSDANPFFMWSST